MALTNAEKQQQFRIRQQQKLETLITENESLREQLEKAQKKIASLERKLAKLTTK